MTVSDQNQKEIEQMEAQLCAVLKNVDLDSVLVGIRGVESQVKPFVIAYTALFAVRYCKRGERSRILKPLEWRHLSKILHLVTKFQLSDPMGFEGEISQQFMNSNPVFSILRIASNQMPYQISLFAQYAQPLMLFYEIPKKLEGKAKVPDFDFHLQFEKLMGAPFLDFLMVSFTAFAAAKFNQGFTRGYFDKARKQGLNVPNNDSLLFILDKIAADPVAINQIYEKYKQLDRRYAPYDFNPLLMRPIIRPWKHKKSIRVEQDRMIAPLPNLITFKMSTGLFYEMFNHYKEDFSQYFGYIFEEYVGEILRQSFPGNLLFSEDDIREDYPSNKGKSPDWVYISGATAVLIECKATRFSRAAATIATEDAIRDSLKQILKGLTQLQKFKEACINKKPGLEKFHSCTAFISILITFEPLYLINSQPFKEYINNEQANSGTVNNEWCILSVEEMERLQPHFKAGVDIIEVAKKLSSITLSQVLDELQKQTHLTIEDCFLYQMDKDLHKCLGTKYE